MAYVKLEHRHLGDDRWLDLSPAAFTVHVWALDHCNEQATDGAIPKSRATRLVCPADPAEIPLAWIELLDSGLWIETDDMYVCPEFTAHGITAEEQTATRNKWSEDKRRQRLHRIGNHQLCTANSCKAVRGQVEESPDVHQWTSGRPDQTRPDPFGSGSGSGTDPDGAGAPPDRAEVEARLGRTAHRWVGDCCPLPPDNPIHDANLVPAVSELAC